VNDLKTPEARATASALGSTASPPFGSSNGKPFARVTLRRLQLDLDLPDPDGWHPLRQKSRFIVLEHARSRSRLVVGTWFDDAPMSHTSCEQRARLYRDFPEGGQLLARQAMTVPDGFASEAVVATIAGEPLRGYLNAFGARRRRCFALSFVTEDRTGDAARAVAERIAVIHERTLAGARMLSDIEADPRQPPAP
jgi:hypothetical protein